MALLENQSILLIAPQPWDHLHISKHHYAISLARQGNTVYYLEPPDTTLSSEIEIAPVAEHAGVWIVRYRPSFPFVLRFHARWIYDRLMQRQIRRIVETIARPIDVVWSFEFNLFTNLRDFGAPLVVFHPVDPLTEPHQVNVACSANAIFTVSEDILANFSDIGVPAWFINHGLSQPFAEAARSALGKRSSRDGAIRVGYAGNLTHPSVNKPVFQRMIEENPSVEFHFWGPKESQVSLAPELVGGIGQFIRFLERSSNVRLHGTVPAPELAQQLQRMDCLVLSYSLDNHVYDRSNSHKMLEYLSTGKAIVSSRVSTYVAHADLLRMPEDGDDSRLPALLRDTLDRLEEFNAPELQDKRRRFALDNTYERQLDRIREKLSSVVRPTP